LQPSEDDQVLLSRAFLLSPPCDATAAGAALARNMAPERGAEPAAGGVRVVSVMSASDNPDSVNFGL